LILPEDVLIIHGIGLQTPRLKRLAEIVSAQAIAQQEKMEFEQPNGNGVEVQGLAISEIEGI
jgi:myosin V